MKYLKIGSKTYYARQDSEWVYLDFQATRKMGLKNIPKDFKSVKQLKDKILKIGKIKSTSDSRARDRDMKISKISEKIRQFYLNSDNSTISTNLLAVYLAQVKKNGDWPTKINIKNFEKPLKKIGLKLLMVSQKIELSPTKWKKLKKVQLFRNYVEITNLKNKKNVAVVNCTYPKLITDKLQDLIHNIKCTN